MSIADKITQLTTIRGNIRTQLAAKGVSGASDHDFSDFATDIQSIQTGVTPTGTITITENGTYDVTEKASAVVNVSGGGNVASGSITVASNTTTLLISDLPFVANFGIVRCTDATKFNGVPKTLGNIYSGITDAEHGIVFRTNSGGTGVGSSSYTANAYAFKISGNSVSCACLSGYPYTSGSTYEWRVGRAE